MHLFSGKRFQFFVLVLVGGCTRPIRARPDTSADRCYEGTGYGFVDTVSAPQAHRTGRMWLILEPIQADEGEARFINEKDALGFAGSWTHRGDSVFIQALTFPSSEWMLSSEPRGLRGRLHAESDNRSHDSKGIIIKQRDDWPALLKSVDCAFVPSRPSNTR